MFDHPCTHQGFKIGEKSEGVIRFLQVGCAFSFREDQRDKNW
jgi:hypothetical protein